MFNDIDEDDDRPIVFKRSNTSNVQNQLNSSAKKSSSQLHSVQQQGRPVSDARSPSPHNGKIASSSKPSSMKSPLASPKGPISSAAGPPVKSPLASPKGSNSSASGPPVKSPVIHSKPVPTVADRPTKITSVVKEERDLVKTQVSNNTDSEDSEDDKPLSVRISTGLLKGNTSQANKGLSTTAAHGSSVLPKSNVTVKESPSDDEDEVPLSSRFQLKSNAGASTSRPYDSNEKKPLASKPNQNGSIARSSQQGKSPTVLNKRPLGEANSSGQSSVKRPKFPVSSTPSKGKQVPVKAEIKEEDEDHMPISQRIKKSSSQDSKSQLSKKTVTKVVSSSFKKSTKSKKSSKSSQYSKSTEVQPNSGDGQKWTTLIHNGVIFPPPYKPHGIKMLYDGKPVDLTPEQEEVATMFAVMKETEYAHKPTFIENFMNDWRKLLGKNHIIKDFTRCDFTPIYEWHEKEKEKKKQMSTDEKKALKEEKLKQEEKYMWAIVDGVKEKVGNFRVEPPGLFRGRGEHPKMGKLKRRICPSEITINIGKNAPVPECPIPGESWKEIKHDNTVTWLAFWNDPINQREFKYVFLAASSSLKGQSDKEKYEKARLLQNHIHRIRAAYTKDFASADKAKRQIAVATYLIDKLALRAGNEKDDDEADTVGCCTLKVENVKPKPPNILQFDFLGKDSIRYENEVEVELPVYKAIEKFRVGKTEGDDLFDMLDTSKLNAHLKELMPGLTAKVFRTYNASITLDDMGWLEDFFR